MSVNRRNFMTAAAALAVSVPFVRAAAAAPGAPLLSEAFQTALDGGVPFEKSLLSASAPVLQAPGDTTMGITWEIRRAADGSVQSVLVSVEYAERADFSDAKIIHRTRAGRRLVTRTDADHARVAMVRLTDLKPNTRYYYRTLTQAVKNGVPVGEPEKSPVYSFATFGPNLPDGGTASFAVVNDPHSHFETWARMVPLITELKPSVVVYNGDLSSWTSSADQMTKDIFEPIRNGDAAGIPFVYSPGNHDSRGGWSRNRHRVLMPRSAGERGTKYEILLHNYAVRIGDLAVIGLDTGEDKADYIWEGQSDFDGQNRLQAEWLAEVMERPDIRSAKQIVVFTHIPLWDADSDRVRPGQEPNYYTYCQYRCRRYWEPILNRANVRLVVSAHTHYRERGPQYLAPKDGPRTWHQLIGGGPCIGDPDRSRSTEDATVIYGQMQADGSLHVRVYSIGGARWVDEYTYTGIGRSIDGYSYAPRSEADRV